VLRTERDVSLSEMSTIKDILKIAETPRRDRMSATAETGERPTTALY
jgi:hypothetical protein